VTISELEPLREEILSLDSLAGHARDLAARHRLGPPSRQDRRLLREMAQARVELEIAHRDLQRVATSRRDLVPAEEWLLDNFHIVEDQLREIREDLPVSYLSELPRLVDDPLAGRPRVYAIAIDFIAHTDARLDRENLVRYVESYQQVAPLTIGELWAIPIMLRLALVENLRRLAKQERAARAQRDLADAWAERLIAQARERPALVVAVLADLARSGLELTDSFVVQLVRRLRDTDAPVGQAFAWIDERLTESATTVEELIRRERNRQSVNQVSVGNCISSMRMISSLDWGAFFDELSLVERALRRDPAGAYPAMDPPSRDLYRHEVERLARRGARDEHEVVHLTLELAEAATDERARHVGYYLIDRGRGRLEREVGYRPGAGERWRRVVLAHPLAWYLGLMALLTLGVIAVPLTLLAPRASAAATAAVVLLTLLPASEVALSLVNLLVSLLFRPRLLPKLRLEDGVPDELRTAVVVPTLLTSAGTLRRLVEDLEIRYLANQDPNLLFALLTDFPDAAAEELPGEAELLDQARAAVEALGARHPDGRFYLLHRRRVWNPRQDIPGASERGCWMGWERKRGKLEELNRLLRGATDTNFTTTVGDLSELRRARYVLTLDTDTVLPRDAARRLVGTIAHPLVRARFDPAQRRVTVGYGLIQPRVSTTLNSAGRSLFARIMTGNTGLDPYTTAVSDVYQDLFGEGTYFGKAIYEVDAFAAALDSRLPADHLLSHDLIEGIFVRVGLATDVELLDDTPSSYLVYAGRQKRWVRGDWALLPWLFRSETPALGRWKIFDNLRRSLLAPAVVLLLLAGWTLLPGPTVAWTLLALSTVALPIYTQVATALLRAESAALTSYLRGFWGDLRVNALRTLTTLVFLTDQALAMVDAIARTVWRLWVIRRNALEWQTAAAAERLARRAGPAVVWAQMWPAAALAAGTLAMVAVARPRALLDAAPICLLWICSPWVAAWISQPTPPRSPRLSAADTRLLRRTGRKTWRFFETFVTADDHFLPPDNFQEDPRGVLARRTSPTNIGLYLISTLAARDFGYLTIGQLAGRLESTLDTLERMDRFRGHLYNWYDTESLEKLQPLYVSTVDSGNLVGHMIALVQGCAEVARAPVVDTRLLDALEDAADLLGEALGTGARRGSRSVEALGQALVEARQAPPTDLAGWRALLEQLLALAEAIVPGSPATDTPATVRRSAGAIDAAFWRGAIVDLLRDTLRELTDLAATESGATIGSPTELAAAGSVAARLLVERLEAIARRVGALAEETDFGLLYDRDRGLFSIGYNIATGQRDASSYDLLASECRLGSLVAIARGEVPQSHWFKLGRPLTRAAGGRALVSWSGTMFEYLMPPLVTRTYWRTLLEETSRAVVAQQIAYATRRGVPWGISESAYNTLDLALNYQYRAFGVPGLGLKPGLAEDLVIAPYATLLAALIDAPAAAANLRRLRDEGLDGRYGYYESIDYTPARVPPGRRGVVVKAFMAHHQGMSLVAIGELLHGEPMARRFHADPRIRATELLLQERVPGAVEIVDRPPAEDAIEAASGIADVGNAERVGRVDGPIPSTMLLSNGKYSVMTTATGAGFSRLDDIAIGRWREDATLDTGGLFVYLRDLGSGRVWSAGFQPTRAQPDEYQCTFALEAVRIRRRDGDVETLTEIGVSPEANVEVRRVALANLSDQPIRLELTSYAELSFTAQSGDVAHPAFANLFVESELDEERMALLCSRRPRASDEPRRWLMHVSAVDGPVEDVFEYETSRASFVGRGRDASAPAALDAGARLSNTVGSPLDPAISLRRVVELPPRGRATVSFATGVGESREHVLELADTFRDPRGVARAFELAWTDARVELRHLGLAAEQAHRFQELASALFFVDRTRRAPPEVLARNTRGQSALWQYGISGDKPIALVRVDDPTQIDLVHDLLLAHEYWRLNGLSADLVILNEDPGGYLQPLQERLLQMVRSSPAQGQLDQSGGVFVRRSDQISDEDRVLLQTVARVVMLTSKGRLARQLARPGRQRPIDWSLIARPPQRRPAAGALPPIEREHANGLGGFTPGGREYAIDLLPGSPTPAPWANVIAGPDFGFVVTESGSGFTWQGNSQQNRLTPWSNDPVSDPAGEALYLRDEESGDLWSPTPLPCPDGAPYRVRHGQGLSVFEHPRADVASELTLGVAGEDPVKVRLLRLENRSGRPRRLTATFYAEWVLGANRDRAAQFVETAWDAELSAMLAWNRYADAQGRVAFAAVSATASEYTGDRAELIGRNGGREAPAALRSGRLSGTVGPGHDPCAAIQVAVELDPGEVWEGAFLLGQAVDLATARALIARYRSVAEARAAVEASVARWDDLLGAIQVRTPDGPLDLMVNRWLFYQALACRFWGRSAFYQSGGAYGFRDQLQDALALFVAAPELARAHILRAASRQFPEGDVQHWWHPDTNTGVRTRYSDDLLWLPYVTAAYVEATDDRAILDERVHFLASRPLQKDEHDLFGVMPATGQDATLYEHCLLAIERGSTAGPHGLPLMGSGDWNDGMNRVGDHGQGESIWLAWFLARVSTDFAPICEVRGDRDRAEALRAAASRLGAIVDETAWDGSWYRRAYFDDGTPLGSAAGEECQIDAIAQSWAVIAGVGDPERARQAMASSSERLTRDAERLLLLLTPPFDRSEPDPGYIRGYLPGVRENGGQYTHGAIWTVLATALLGDGDRAHELFSYLNPVNHGRTPAEVAAYKVEPYVVAADVYANEQHVGRGGWTWYTGSAGWLYRLAVETILGLRLVGGRLRIDPTIPRGWAGFEARVRGYTVVVENPDSVCRGVARVELDGRPIEGDVPLESDGQEHRVRVVMGTRVASPGRRASEPVPGDGS
jgi:cyclic beta-1,2-glucan synthetase